MIFLLVAVVLLLYVVPRMLWGLLWYYHVVTMLL